MLLESNGPNLIKLLFKYANFVQYKDKQMFYVIFYVMFFFADLFNHPSKFEV